MIEASVLLGATKILGREWLLAQPTQLPDQEVADPSLKATAEGLNISIEQARVLLAGYLLFMLALFVAAPALGDVICLPWT
jgi:hypothetical protein